MGIGVVLGLALAQETSWTVGLPVAQVDLVAVEGELPAEDLLPLLAMQQGQSLSIPSVRSDIALLYSTGAFGAVQADAEPWFVEVEGEAVPAVRLTYEVVSLPEVVDIEVEGAAPLRKRQVLAALRVAPGDRWLAEEDVPAARWRVLVLYAELGFEGTRVSVRTREWAPGELVLEVQVVEGTPVLLEMLTFGEAPLSEQAMRRAARRGGLVVGRSYTPRQVRGAREELQQLYRDEGFLEARVRALEPERQDDEPRQVSFFIEAGPRLVVEVPEGRRGDVGRVERWLALEQEVRVDRTLVSELEGRVVQGLMESGFPDASATVEYQETDDEKRLVVRLDPGVSMDVDGWVFDGNAAIPDEVLAESLREASPDVLGRSYLTDDALQDGLAALIELYRSRGYVAATLHVRETRRTTGRRRDVAVVVIEVQEGPRTQVEGVFVEGAAPEMELAVQGLAAALDGEPYSPASLVQLEQAVTVLHREQGYLDADARAEVTLAEDGRTASVVLQVAPGGRLYVRNVVLRGQKRTRTEVIAQEVELQMGQPITPAAVSETRSQLYELDAFRAVKVDLQGTGDRYRDVVVTVDEKPAWTLEGGGGLATDEGLRTVGRATRRGLWGRAHRLTLLGRVGVGYDGDTWRPSAEDVEWYAGARYEAPNAPRNGQVLYADIVANERQQEPTYRLARGGAGVGVVLRTTPNSEITVTHRVHGRWLEDVDPGALVVGDPWLAYVEDDFSSPRLHGEFETVWLLDRRDDRFNPTEGMLASAEVSVTDPLTTGFWSVQGNVRGQVIVPVGQMGLHLDGRAGLGWVEGRGTTLPLEERYRLGGASTLRGFPLDTVGPKNELPDLILPYPDQISGLVDYATRDQPLRWVPTGGDSMLLMTAEWWVPFPMLGLDWTSTTLVAFADVGNVYFLDPTVFATSTVVQPEPFLRYGVGLGVRQVTPIGPLRLDLAVNPVWFQQEWARDRGEVPVRVHLSLGAL